MTARHTACLGWSLDDFLQKNNQQFIFVIFRLIDCETHTPPFSSINTIPALSIADRILSA